jgi:hypothetical protein
MVLKTRSQIKIPQHYLITYTGFVTALLEHETLTGVDEKTRQLLAAAADNYENGPARLQAEILDAARAGEKPAAITRAIGYVYTYDYVAKLVRLDRKANPGLYVRAES